jgi:hypothetical protein
MSAMLVIMLSMCLLAGDPASAATKDAEADIARDHLELRSYGKPAPWSGEYTRLLKEKMGVERVRIAGCVVGDELATAADAYNRVMRQEIKRRFGDDVFDKLVAEGKQEYKRMQDEEKRGRS